VEQKETVPDPVVRDADQVELVDMAPEALRRRMAHGNIYPPERIDAALANYFRTGNLTALRELALLWVADRVDEELNEYRERHNIARPWETKERVVVSITGAKGSAVLIRRAARMAMRTKAELVGVHVRTDDSLTGPGSKGLAENRALLEDLGGRFVEVVGTDVAPALVKVARAENATQLVMGATHRNRVNEIFKGSVINSAIRAAGGSLDVHVIATDAESNAELRVEESESGKGGDQQKSNASPGRANLRRYVSPLPLRRVVAALIIGAVGFPLLTLVLTSAGNHASLATALSSYLVLVVIVAAVGGVWPGLLAAAAGFLLSNYLFAPPVHTFTIGNARDILALTMFLVTAGVVSVLVDLAARRTAAAARARNDARVLARVAARLVSPEGNPLPALLDELRIAFHLDAAAVLRSTREPGEAHGPSETTWTKWGPVATSGEDPPLDPKGAPVVLPLTDRELLVLRGPGLAAEDRDVLAAFAAQLSAALESDRLQAEAAEAGTLAQENRLRSALLAGVSHDLRAPLAAIKAASTSLLSDRLTFGPEETRTLLHTIDDDADRLNAMLENLLDMGRIESGSVQVMRIPTQVGEVVAKAVEALGPRRAEVVVDIPHDLPPISTDPGLLERAIANLLDNGLVHAGGKGLRVEAGTVAGRIDIRVVDRGPGIPREERERILHPFERLAEPDSQSGIGLGLAVARGFVDAIGGDLDLEDTPGGGATWIVRLPLGVPGKVRAAEEPDSTPSLS
jgi:two-component system sensor histidine kinase KdpD